MRKHWLKQNWSITKFIRFPQITLTPLQTLPIFSIDDGNIAGKILQLTFYISAATNQIWKDTKIKIYNKNILETEISPDDIFNGLCGGFSQRVMYGETLQVLANKLSTTAIFLNMDFYNKILITVTSGNGNVGFSLYGLYQQRYYTE